MRPHYFTTLSGKIIKIKVSQRYYKHTKIQWVTNNRNRFTPLKKKEREKRLIEIIVWQFKESNGVG